MFTQCPECGTVFRVTAAVLRAAQGQVRCGVCDANFDALRFLTDAVEGESPPPAETAPPPPAAPRPSPVPAAPPPPKPVAAPPPAPPPPPPPVPPAPRPSFAGRSTPSADEDRAIAEIAAALARDAEASRERVAREEAEEDALTPAAAVAREPEDANILEPADVENIVLGGEARATEEPSEAALEFNVPPGQWDRVFVAEDGTDTITPLDINLGELERVPPTELAVAEDLLTFIDDPPVPPPAEPPPPPRPASASPRTESAEDDDPLSRTDEFALLEPELASLERAAAEAEPVTRPPAAPAAAPAARAGDDEDAIDIEDAWFDPGHGVSPPEPAAPATRTASLRAPVPEPEPEPLPEPAPYAFPEDDSGLVVEPRPAPEPRSRVGAVSGALALALLLGGQLVHHNREALASVEGVGPPLTRLYATLGRPIEPRWDLGSYDVKQWGAATDNAPGSLRLRASVVNRAARAQPYPLLRVTLEDRFGSKVARREFTPAEYLPGHTTPAGLLAAGARADAELLLADPGSQAVGFELDVCLPRGGVLSCGAEPKAAGGG